MPFIVFEGLDGSGKSSLMKCLDKELSDRGQRVSQTREPGGTPLSEEIRELILRPRPATQAPSARTELLLYEAARAQHVHQVIRPLCAQGAWVLCDRFTASSLAFQGQGRDLSWDSVVWLNSFATEGVKPDLQILVDVPLDLAQERMAQRAPKNTLPAEQYKDRIEAEDAEFHERVRQGFLRQAQIQPQDWLILDGRKTLAELTATVLQCFLIKTWLPA